MDELLTEIQKETLRERDSRLVRIIESLGAIMDSKEWSTLKENVFDDVYFSIERRMKKEMEKPEISLPEMYRLQGEMKWAKKYSNLDTLREVFHQELVKIRKITITPGDGAP